MTEEKRKSLANRYRPKAFEDVIGQSHIIDILQAKIAKHENSSHNYIFYGPRGTGKTSTARLFAKAINAINVDAKGNPLPDDLNVQAIDKGTTLDYVEIDAASHTGVDNIREEILAKVPYPPTMLKKKVYVIDEVHMLSTGAFNALLKTIEEPREYVVFILATTEIHKVPDTIISRCQVFNFKKVSEHEIIEHLANIATKESLPYDHEALGLIAGISDGCVRDAVKYLDQVSILGSIDTANVSKFLWVASEKRVHDFLASIAKQDREEVFTQVDRLQEDGIDLYNFAKQLLQYIDKHLMENIDGYLAISQSCSEILSTIRYYPYPAIVYKIAFNKLLAWPQVASQDTAIAQSSTKEPQKDNKPIEPQKQETISPSINQETPGQPIPVVVQEIETIQESKTQEAMDTNNFDDVKNQLLAKIDKQSLKDSLTDNIYIQAFENNTVHMITISSMANMLLQKQDTIQYLEKLLAEIYGAPVALSITFTKKEDFLQSMM